MMVFVTSFENRVNDDEEDEPGSPRQCVDCGACAPKTQTAHTLISSKHGWRLSRARDGASDGYTFQWRCPKCWASHKSKAPDSGRY